MRSKKQLKNRSGTLMDRKLTPKVVQQGGPGGDNEPPFSSLETLWAALGSHMVPRPPKIPACGPQVEILDHFLINF